MLEVEEADTGTWKGSQVAHDGTAALPVAL